MEGLLPKACYGLGMAQVFSSEDVDSTDVPLLFSSVLPLSGASTTHVT